MSTVSFPYVNGTEIPVSENCLYLNSSIETIKKYKPKILLEYNAGNMSQCGHSMEELNSLIDEIDYETFWFDNGENLFIQSR